MPHYKVLVRGAMDSAVPEDAFVNTWHCNVITEPDGIEDFVDDLEAFYQAIDSLLSVNVDATKIKATAYRMTDPTPRAPIYDKTFTSITTSTDAWPPELAMCLSFQGTRASGTSQARRRGRVYIGPLGQQYVSSTNPRLNASAVSTLAGAAGALQAASEASSTYHWCVFSTVTSSLVVVDNGWVDNAPDIQRRRGTAASDRSTW